MVIVDEYIKKNKQIIHQWYLNNEKGIVADGIVDPTLWFSSNGEKILFLLKEAYSTEDATENWDLTKWLNNTSGCRCSEQCKKNCVDCWPTGTTYNHVAEAAYQILNESQEFDEWLGLHDDLHKEYRKKRREILRQIAVINLKKCAGTSVTNPKSLKEHAEKYGELIKRQISIIKPTVIICGGTYPMLRKLYGTPKLENEYDGGVMLNGIKVIAAYHPNKAMKSKEKAERIYNQYAGLKV